MCAFRYCHNMPRCGVQLQSIGASEQIGAMSPAALWLVPSYLVNQQCCIQQERDCYTKKYLLKVLQLIIIVWINSFCEITHGSFEPSLQLGTSSRTWVHSRRSQPRSELKSQWGDPLCLPLIQPAENNWFILSVLKSTIPFPTENPTAAIYLMYRHLSVLVPNNLIIESGVEVNPHNLQLWFNWDAW